MTLTMSRVRRLAKEGGFETRPYCDCDDPLVGQMIGCVGLRGADVLCGQMRVIGKDKLDGIGANVF